MLAATTDRRFLTWRYVAVVLAFGISVVVLITDPALAAKPNGTDVADVLVAGGVPITYDAIETGPRSAEAATDAADISITVYKSNKAREADQVRRARRLAKTITEPAALPYLAYATCGPILVELADGLRAVDPGPLEAQVQGVLESEYGPCPEPGRKIAKAQSNASRKVCGALLDAGIAEVEATIADEETDAIGATPAVADAWRAAVASLGTPAIGDAQPTLSSACRDGGFL